MTRYALGGSNIPFSFQGPAPEGCTPGIEYAVGSEIAGFDGWSAGDAMVLTGSATTLNVGEDFDGSYPPGFYIAERSFESPEFSVTPGCIVWRMSFHMKVILAAPGFEGFDATLALALVPNFGQAPLDDASDDAPTGCLVSIDGFNGPTSDAFEMFYNDEEDPGCPGAEFDVVLTATFPTAPSSLIVRGWFSSDNPSSFGPGYPESVNCELSDFKVISGAA